jgi:hypothetical protein
MPAIVGIYHRAGCLHGFADLRVGGLFHHDLQVLDGALRPLGI